MSKRMGLSGWIDVRHLLALIGISPDDGAKGQKVIFAATFGQTASNE